MTEEQIANHEAPSTTGLQMGSGFLVAALACLVSADVAGAYRLVNKIQASPSEQGEYFGTSLSIDGARLLVGAYRNNTAGTDAGAMYVFEPDAVGTWSEVAMLVPGSLGSHSKFGWRVSLSGDRAVGGAPDAEIDGVWTGAAYVFERDGGGSWTEVARLVGADSESGDRFGVSVAIDGDRLVVGVLTDDDRGEDAGAAYVFERDGGGVWSEVAKLTASDGGPGRHFGRASAISGDRVVVGSTSLYGLDDPGACYVFERDPGGAWTEVAKLVADDGALQDLFGWSVAIEGVRIVVGAQDNEAGGAPANSGAAYVFERDGGGTWAQTAKLTASNPAAEDRFGYSIGLSGDRVVVGADTADGPGTISGASYVFELRSGGIWEETAILKAYDAKSVDWYGHSVAVDGDGVAVAADRLFSGSAYVYRVGFACPATPATGCRTGWGKASLLVRENTPDKEFLRALLSRGPATVATDFGDPVGGTTAYDLCVFDEADQLVTSLSVHRGGQDCATGRSCWKSKDGVNYGYKDRFSTSDGVSAVKLSFGDEGNSKILVKAGNKPGRRVMPTGAAAALFGASTARIQLLSSDGECFEADAQVTAIPSPP